MGGKSRRNFIFFLYLIAGSALGDIIHVPADQPTIQGAIDIAASGDTVLVDDGTYNENVTIDKSDITIESKNGPGNTVILSPTTDHVIEITADFVNFRGFGVERAIATPSYGSGIVVSMSQGCEISDNKIGFNSHGVALTNSRFNLVKDNVVTGVASGISLRDFSDYNEIS